MKIIFKILINIKRKFEYWVYKQSINKLVKNGLTIGKNVTIREDVNIDVTYAYLVTIGNNCEIGSGVEIIAHDGTTRKFNGDYEKIAKVEIKDNCFIGRNAIILPGVTIGPNVIIAAGSVVNKNIAPNSLVAGVPARIYGKFAEIINHDREIIKQSKYYKHHDLLKADLKTKKKIAEELNDKPLFVYMGDKDNPFTIS